jgi:hypothetical protein
VFSLAPPRTIAKYPAAGPIHEQLVQARLHCRQLGTDLMTHRCRLTQLIGTHATHDPFATGNQIIQFFIGPDIQ